jgi:hypothetical protein
MTLATLKLLHGLLCSQQLNLGAKREDIDEALTARDELEAAIAAAEKAND